MVRQAAKRRAHKAVLGREGLAGGGAVGGKISTAFQVIFHDVFLNEESRTQSRCGGRQDCRAIKSVVCSWYGVVKPVGATQMVAPFTHRLSRYPFQVCPFDWI